VMLMARMGNTLNHVQSLNLAMQKFLRQWGEVSQRRNRAQMLDQASLPWFKELNRGLRDTLTGAAFDDRIAQNMTLLNELALETVQQAIAEYPSLANTAEDTEIRATLKAYSAFNDDEVGDQSKLFKRVA
jgi:hypothetical protein